MGARLALETSAARLVGRLSRAAGRGGGTTLPGKLVWKLDPGALDALAARLPQGVALVSATNGKTTTTAMAELDSRPHPPARLEQLRREPRVGRHLDAAGSGRRRARPARGRRVRAPGDDAADATRASCASATSSATSSTATASSSTSRSAGATAVAGLDRAADARRERRRPAPCRARRRSRDDASASASTIRGVRAPASSTPPTRSTASAAVTRTATTRPTSGISARTGASRAAMRGRALDVAAREIEPDGLEGVSFDLHTPDGSRARPPRRPRPLQRLQRARRCVARALARRPARRHRRGARSASGRPSGASSGSRSAIAASCSSSSRTRPARTRRSGRSRTAACPPTLVVALNDRIADGRDVSWIWDVDFEPVLDRAERIVASGERAAELGAPVHLRRLPTRAARDRARPRGGPRPRARADPGRRRARGPPDVHRDAGAARDRHGARTHATVLGKRRRMIIRVGHLYPEYLNIYADRGNIAVFERRAAARGHELASTPVTLGVAARAGSARPPLRGRRPGSGAGDDRARPRSARRARSAPPSTAAPRCSPSAAATSCSGAAIAGATDPGSPARRSSRTRRSPARPA